MAEANGFIDLEPRLSGDGERLLEACEDVVNVLAHVLNDLTGQAVAALAAGDGMGLFRYPEVSAEILRDAVFELRLVALDAEGAE